MKALLLVLIFSLSFFPFAFSSRQFPFSPPVVDVEAKVLKLGEPYYVLSNVVARPEGLCLHHAKNQSESCPHDIVQCTIFQKSHLGLPVIFSSDNQTEDNVVRENTPYNLQFSVDGDCANETVWSLTDTGIPVWKYVGTDPDTPSVQFQVKKSGLGYKIVFCETIPFAITPLCFGVGFITDGLYSRLVTGLGVKSVEFFFVGNETVVENMDTYKLA